MYFDGFSGSFILAILFIGTSCAEFLKYSALFLKPSFKKQRMLTETGKLTKKEKITISAIIIVFVLGLISIIRSIIYLTMGLKQGESLYYFYESKTYIVFILFFCVVTSLFLLELFSKIKKSYSNDNWIEEKINGLSDDIISKINEKVKLIENDISRSLRKTKKFSQYKVQAQGLYFCEQDIIDPIKAQEKIYPLIANSIKYKGNQFEEAYSNILKNCIYLVIIDLTIDDGTNQLHFFEDACYVFRNNKNFIANESLVAKIDYNVCYLKKALKRIRL